MLGRALQKRSNEMYRVDLEGRGFLFTISELFFCYLLQHISAPSLKEDFLTIPRGRDLDRITFLVELPFISFPNLSHKKADYKKLAECSHQIAVLFKVFNFVCRQEEEPEAFKIMALSDQQQLMVITTGYCNNGGGFHSSPIEVGFNQVACESLINKYPEGAYFDGCVDVAHDVYLGLREPNQREICREKSRRLKSWHRHTTGITVMLREEGAPHFVVPGSCACLGANPDEFKWQRSMYSHNIDSPLQQMTMLAALVSFWNSVLRSL